MSVNNNNIDSITIDYRIAYYLLKDDIIKSKLENNAYTIMAYNDVPYEFSTSSPIHKVGYLFDTFINRGYKIGQLKVLTRERQLIMRIDDNMKNYSATIDIRIPQQDDINPLMMTADLAEKLIKSSYIVNKIKLYLPYIVLANNAKYEDRKIDYYDTVLNNFGKGVEEFFDKIVEYKYTSAEFIDIMEITGLDLIKGLKDFIN